MQQYTDKIETGDLSAKVMFNPRPPFELKKERKKEKGGRRKKGKEKQETTMIHWESHPIFTGACFDLNVLIEVSQTVVSLNSLAIL